MIRRANVLIVGLLLSAVAASAQVQQRPVGVKNRPLQGEAKLRWVCEQLELNDQQTQQVDAFVVLYNADIEEAIQNKEELLRKMQVKLAEIDKAKEDGDDARVRKLQAELAKMGPETAAENGFYENLAQILTDQQKAKLPDLRARAKTVYRQAPQPPTPPPAPPRPAPPATATGGNAELRPIHVLKAVQSLGLSPEQYIQLEQMLADFRTNMRATPPKEKPEFIERVEQLIRDIRPILTADQGTAFDLAVAGLRREPPVAQPFVMPVVGPPPAEARPKAAGIEQARKKQP